MRLMAYISLTISVCLIVVAGTAVEKTARYDMLNQASWVFVYLFGMFYSRELVLRLIFTALSVLASVEFLDEIRNANNTLNIWEYLLIPLAAAWCFVSYKEIKKLQKKRHEQR